MTTVRYPVVTRNPQPTRTPVVFAPLEPTPAPPEEVWDKVLYATDRVVFPSGLGSRIVGELVSSAAVFPQTLDATLVLSASVSRSIGKIQTAAVNCVATMTKQVGKILTVALVLAATVTKNVGKILNATAVVVAATLTAIKVFLVTMNATAVTCVATMRRSVGKNLNAVVSTVGTYTKQIGKAVVASVILAPTMTKQIAKTLGVSLSTVASLVAQFISGSAATIVGRFRSTPRGQVDSDPDAGNFDHPNPGGRVE